MSEASSHAVAEVYRELGRRGFVPGSAGNVSARCPDGVLITPSGCAAEAVNDRNIAFVADDGKISGGMPSSELPMHMAIYQAFPQARAIVHTHAEACTALACLNQGLPAFHYMVTVFGGEDVRCAPYVTFGTAELAELAVEALRDRTACLLANHGMIVHAPSLDRALSDAIILESLCRQYLLARAAGTPRLLTAAEIAGARERFKTYGPGASPAASTAGSPRSGTG
ncbi:MAG TPA: class II aldolase/adducin family protein [Acetobacteraceae bacterium]